MGTSLQSDFCSCLAFQAHRTTLAELLSSPCPSKYQRQGFALLITRCPFPPVSSSPRSAPQPCVHFSNQDIGNNFTAPHHGNPFVSDIYHRL